MPGQPDVSLITSWHAGSPGMQDHPLLGLVQALRKGIGVVDLYFLSHQEIPWYMDAVERALARQEPGSPVRGLTFRDTLPPADYGCPLRFAAALTPGDITLIAEALLDLMVREYGGRLVGPRPRFAALATYWPLITDDHVQYRDLSIKAVRNSLLLAEALGCRHVEIVGGSAFSLTDGGDIPEGLSRDDYARRVRRRRILRLARSLTRVVDPAAEWTLPEDAARAWEENGTVKNADEPEVWRRNPPGGDPPNEAPWLCLEMEPGAAFLIRHVKDYHHVHQWLPPAARPRVLLNIDLAHMFLARTGDPGEPPETHAGERQLNYLKAHELESHIGHFHCSDHARTHASDLCPGSYHFYRPDYEPWLKLAWRLTGGPRFSNAVAVEMEACSDIHEIQRAIGRTQSWLKLAGEAPAETSETSETTSLSVKSGIIMAVDIVNSTSVLAREGVNPEKGALRIDAAVSALCRKIHAHRGSVYSFTGDGVVAFFDPSHFTDDAACAHAALKANDGLFAAMRDGLQARGFFGDLEARELALRTSLLRGAVRIPDHGHLRHQVLGADVIIACRLLTAAEPPPARGTRKPSPGTPKQSTFTVISHAIHAHVRRASRWEWNQLSVEMLKQFKGLNWALLEESLTALYQWQPHPPIPPRPVKGLKKVRDRRR